MKIPKMNAMKSSIFSLKKDSLSSFIDAFITYKDSLLTRSKPFLSYEGSSIVQPIQRKVYVTDMERDITYAGTVESLIKSKGNIKISLVDVQVYQYSSSNPLYDLPKIDFSRPESKLYIEDVQ